MLVPLVLWFESVAWVDIQPLLGLEHFFFIFQVTTDYSSKKGLRQAVTYLLFSGKTEGLQSTNLLTYRKVNTPTLKVSFDLGL